jgi:hypothetical protein
MAKGHIRYYGLVRGPHVEKITVSGVPNLRNYCVIYMVFSQFTNVAVGRWIYCTQHFYRTDLLVRPLPF